MKVRIKNPIWGVPITFLDKYCPTQFEILGVTNNTKDNAFALKENTIGYSTWASINGKNVYTRLLIRRRYYESYYES